MSVKRAVEYAEVAVEALRYFVGGVELECVQSTVRVIQVSGVLEACERKSVRSVGAGMPVT